MIPQGWVVLVAGVGGTLALLGVRRLLRRARDAPDLDAVDVPDTRAKAGASLGPDDLLCRECGARNDADYRFCRYCASELPRVPSSNVASVESITRGA